MEIKPGHLKKNLTALIFALMMFVIWQGKSFAIPTYIYEAIQHYHNAEFGKAKTIFEKAVRQEKSLGNRQISFAYLALIEMAFGNTSQADSWLTKLLRLNPSVKLRKLPHFSEDITSDLEARFNRIKSKNAPPTKGKLFVDTEPENAKVAFLNTESRFKQGMELKAGKYHLEVSAKGYKSHREWAKIPAGKEKKLSIRLKQIQKVRKGHLFVNAEPENAKVEFLNIESKFRRGMELDAGKYHLEVSAPGCKSRREWTTILAGKDRRLSIRLEAMKKARKEGRLFINAEPGNARVEFLNIESEFRKGMKLDAGKYHLEVSAPGCKSRREWTTILAGKDRRLSIRLEAMKKARKEGRLFINAEPGNARVEFLNIESEFRQGMKLDAGKYHLEISAEGHKAKREWTEILAGKDRKIRIRLKQEKTTPERGRLFVNTEPENARVKIRGIKPKFKQGIELDPRRYGIEVSAKGYDTQKEWADIAAGEDKKLDIRLNPKEKFGKKGRLFVNTDPGNARVKIRGIKPKFKQGIELAPRRYQIEVSAKGYDTQKEWADIAAGKDKKLNIRLNPKEKLGRGRLFVNTEPENARVKIRGIKPKFRQGIELAPRRYQIEVLAKGYNTKKEWVTIATGEDKTLDIYLEPKGKKQKSRLFVNADPEDAKVRIIGMKSRFWQGMELKPRRYQVEVLAPGYKTLKEQIKIVSGQDTTLDIHLKPRGKSQKPRLFVNVEPEDARVKILKIKPRFRQGIELRPGRYHLEFSAKGYKIQRGLAELVAGEDKTLTIRLEPKRGTISKGKSSKGKLFVDTEPKSAKIKIVGIKSRFYQGVPLQSGWYFVEVSAKGYDTWKKQTEIIGGENTKLNIRLNSGKLARKKTVSAVRKQSASKDLRRKLAVFSWILKDDVAAVDRTIQRVINEKKDVFVLKYTIHKKDAGRRIGNMVIDADSIEKAWVKKSFLSNPKPNVDAVCKFGKKLSVDAVLMGNLNTGQLFLLDAKTCKLFSVSGSSSGLPYSLKRILKAYTGDFDSGLERVLHNIFE